MIIVPVTIEEERQFRQMVMEYWQFVIPGSFTLSDPIQAEAEFQERYQWSGGNNNPHWIKVDDRSVGFLMMRIYDDGVTAYIHDFYLTPNARRQGYGTELYSILREQLKDQGVKQVYLSVQADNPAALDFWKKQGFRVIYHRLAQSI
jgi:ribosomal protein S18 acetylase RimI-like enzyme